MLNKLTIKVVKHTYTTKHKKNDLRGGHFLFGISG